MLFRSDTASILRYLSSRAIKGIGPKTAQRIVEEFGEDSFDVIENHPEWLASIKGISMKTALAASESFREQAGIRSAMIFFREFFGVATTVKIYKQWGARAVDIAKKNPYRLCNEIDGIGFERADHMARSLGFDADHTERLMSGILYVLSQHSAQNGHVCFPRTQLIETAAKILSVEASYAEQALAMLLQNRSVRVVRRGETEMIYDAASYEAEKYVAEKLIFLDAHCASVDLLDIDRFIEGEEAKSGIRYASLQKLAMSDALRYGVMILTGGPGTGKTTVINLVVVPPVGLPPPRFISRVEP